MRIIPSLISGEFSPLSLGRKLAISINNTMPACRCGWEMKPIGRLWVCENWRPWSFWRHDITVRPPTRRRPCM